MSNIGYWDRADAWVSWKIKVTTPGAFHVTADIAAITAGSEIVFELADQKVDRSGYQTIGDSVVLDNWITRAIDLG